MIQSEAACRVRGKCVVVVFGKVVPVLERSYVTRRKMSLGSYTKLSHPLPPKIP